MTARKMKQNPRIRRVVLTRGKVGKMLLVSIQDTVSKLFLAPFIEQNEETAKRTFKVLCREPGMISKSPSDYQILQVGEFNQETGEVAGCTHKLIITGKEATEE